MQLQTQNCHIIHKQIPEPSYLAIKLIKIWRHHLQTVNLAAYSGWQSNPTEYSDIHNL